MPNTRIWVHLIFSTKNRERIISNELKGKLLYHIKENSTTKGIYIDCLNCVRDHIHILLTLGRDQCISKIVQLIKGESSHWINKNRLSMGRFEWQDDYIAVSISESAVEKVRLYIGNQEIHHKKKTFAEEFNIVMKVYGFRMNVGNEEESG